MRKLPHMYIIMFAIAGLALGVATGTVNRYVNIAIHKKFSKDSPAVTAMSLVVQFIIMMGGLILAATHMPYITPDDLGGGVASFAFVNLYFTAQVHLIQEINKFVDNKFDGLERYK
jgi:hypothetical protein